jgi:hypothetical protein
MNCGFCARPIHIIEDYIYHEGLAFHPQRASENNVHCSPRVRAFDEEQVASPAPGAGVTTKALTLRAASVTDRG